jgi:hypothetical protein
LSGSGASPDRHTGVTQLSSASSTQAIRNVRREDVVVSGWLWIALSFITLASLGILVAGRDNGDLIRFFADMNLRQHETMTALTLSALSFLILGLALSSIPA